MIPAKRAIFLMGLMGLAVLPAWAAPPEHEFVGSKKCSLCHKKPEKGQQYDIWLHSKHAKAIETLASPESKAIAEKMGIADPEKSGKCLKCHSTAYWFSEELATQTIAVEEGVSCESCHGPGKDYSKKSVMEERELAKEAGLLIPDEKTCRLCHNEEAPTFQSFNYEERWEKIKHPVPR